jgi:hypothetical protein
MELVNDFTVNRPIDETWATLTDVPKIAPCLPGAHLEDVKDGDVYHGVVKLKVGPILANFKGEAHFVEKDDVRHRAVLNAAGRDTGNKGNAAAVITAQLEAINATTTRCTVSTDLKITGKFAQFGRGAMQDISNKLLGEFVRNLETLTARAPAGPESDNGAATEPASSPIASNGHAAATSQPISADALASENVLDLGKYAGGAIAKRLIPVVVGVLVLLLVLRRRHRRR